VGRIGTVNPPLALGVSIPWARSGPADFTPLLAMVAAVLVARFVVGVRLTLPVAVVAAAAGAAWAAAIPTFGTSVPTLAAITATALLRCRVGVAGHE
jgi:hypothetical protein